MRHIELFAGSGMFAYAASQVWSDHEPVVFVEKDSQCIKLLSKKFPGTKIIDDIEKFNAGDYYGSIDIVSGGDPCPIRSRAHSNGKGDARDLSGFFLRVVAESRPRWVLRENVPASDDVDFATALELLGYRTAIIRADAAPFTAQQRVRDFIIGSNKDAWKSKLLKHYNIPVSKRFNPPVLGTRSVISCLVTHGRRYNPGETFIFDGKFRLLDAEERQRFAGMPGGWLDGFSKSCVARMTGNSVVPQVVIEIMKIIKEIDEGE